MEDIIKKVQKVREQYHKSISRDLADRVKYEMKDTIKVVNKMRLNGATDRDIHREVNKYLKSHNKYEH